MYRLVLIAALSALPFVFPSTASAGKKCCCKCGCEQKVKKVRRLVRTYQQIEIPTYQCLPTSTFHPHRGKICQDGYRYDMFYSLHKNCDGTRDCCPHPARNCRPLYGGNPAGCFSHCGVRQPTDVRKQTVMVMKWVAMQLCEDCCRRSGKH